MFAGFSGQYPTLKRPFFDQTGTVSASLFLHVCLRQLELLGPGETFYGRSRITASLSLCPGCDEGDSRCACAC